MTDTLLTWWRKLPVWAAILLGTLAASMFAATVLIGAAVVGSYLVTRWWFWILFGVVLAAYLLAMWASKLEDK
jgi:hypothetical protein